MQPIAESLHHRCTASDNNCALQTRTQVDITSFDAIADELMYTWVLEANQARAEEDLGCTSLISVADIDLRAIGQYIVIRIVLACIVFSALVRTETIVLALRELVSRKHSSIVICTSFSQRNLGGTVHLLDFSDDLKLSSCTE